MLRSSPDPSKAIVSDDRPRSWDVKAAFVICVLLFLLLTGYARWTMQSPERGAKGEEAPRIAWEETDLVDPGLRPEEFRGERKTNPEAGNSASVVLIARQRLPKGWPTWRSLDRLVGREVSQYARWKYERGILNLPPNVQLNSQQLAVLKAELSEADAALIAARPLSELPEGRLPSTPSMNPFDSALSPPINPHGGKPRDLAELLAFDVLVRTQEGDLGEALVSCSALINAGRSVGDEPEGVAQNVRLGCTDFAVRRLERVLAQGIPPAQRLQRLQRLLEDEAQVPIALIVARGERASGDFMMERLTQGLYSEEELEKAEKIAAFFDNSSPLEGQEKKDAMTNGVKWYAPERVAFHRTWLLQFHTAAVEICKQPDWLQEEMLAKWKKEMEGQPAPLRFSVNMFIGFCKKIRRNRAYLRCAAIAVALERYRQANDHWPDSLEDLIPEQMQAIPLDPFDGQPMSYRHDARNAVVFSIGPNGKNKGELFQNDQSDNSYRDLSFRLWSPQWRRQSARPVQPLEQQDNPNGDNPE